MEALLQLFLNFSGYVYVDPIATSKYPHGPELAYSTISYANGPGFYKHFTNDSRVPWKDMRSQVLKRT